MAVAGDVLPRPDPARPSLLQPVLSAHPPRRAAAGVKAAAERPPLSFASLTAPVICAARRLIEEWPRIEGHAIEGPGTRIEGLRNEERAQSRRACLASRFLFATVYRRLADREVLRPSSGCRHRATCAVYVVRWVDRPGITCKPRLTRVDRQDYT